MIVRTIMSRNVLTVSLRHPASDALALMRDARVRHAVVSSMGTIAGIVTERDLGGPQGGAFRRGRTVEDVMHRPVRHVGSETTIEEAALLMRKEHIGCLPVVDRGQLVGIVTRGDLLSALATGRKGGAGRATAADAHEPLRAPRFVSPNRDKWP